jgi:hypothetical protein
MFGGNATRLREALRSIGDKIPAMTFEQSRREEPDGSLAGVLAEHFATEPFSDAFRHASRPRDSH